MAKTALVCGGGIHRGHLVRKLKAEGYWVRGVDIKEHEFAPSAADEFLLLDLRQEPNCQAALRLGDGTFDEVYQLAADMGGMGFIHAAECEIMHNSALINIHMIHNAAQMGVAALLLLLLGLRLPRHAARRAGDGRGRGHPRQPGQRVRLGEALRRAHGDGLRPATTTSRCASPASRTATGRTAPGRAGGKRPPPPSAARSRRWRTGGTIEVWGDGSAIRSYNLR
jgi:hypothetical protein